MQRLHALVSATLLLALGWFAVSSFAPSSPSAFQSSTEQAAEPALGRTIYLVRHAEKAKDDPRDPTLTAEGTERARELARVLGQAGVTHLFSTPYKRTRATVAPLAEAHELSIEPYDPRKLQEFVKQLGELPAGSVAVVSGHSNTTPGLFEALGGKQASGLVESSYGLVIPDDGYDRLFSVTLAEIEGEVRSVAAVELRFGKP